MLLGTLGASLLGNILAGKGAIAKRQGRRAIKTSQGQGVIRAGDGEILKAEDLLELAMDLQSKTRIFNATLSFN